MTQFHYVFEDGSLIFYATWINVCMKRNEIILKSLNKNVLIRTNCRTEET